MFLYLSYFLPLYIIVPHILMILHSVRGPRDKLQNMKNLKHIRHILLGFVPWLVLILPPLFDNWSYLIIFRTSNIIILDRVIIVAFTITLMERCLTLSWRWSLSHRNQICRANQWTGFCMIRTSVMKELIFKKNSSFSRFQWCLVSNRNQSYVLHIKTNGWFLYEMKHLAEMG